MEVLLHLLPLRDAIEAHFANTYGTCFEAILRHLAEVLDNRGSRGSRGSRGTPDIRIISVIRVRS